MTELNETPDTPDTPVSSEGTGATRSVENEAVAEQEAPPEEPAAPTDDANPHQESGAPLEQSHGPPEVVSVEGQETDARLREAVNDPEVRSALEDRWNASSVDDPANRHEEGAWLVRDSETGQMSVESVEPGVRDGIRPGSPPSGEGQEVVGFYHSHPNPPIDETGTTWTQGPSDTDKAWSDRNNVPLVVQSSEGYHLYYPNQG